METKYSVPFTIDKLNHGLQEAKGLLKVSETGLDFEFEVKDTIIGVVKSGLTKVQIPFKDIESITFNKGFIKSKIKIEGTSMSSLSDLPGVDVATCTLKIKRKDSNEAANLISKARLGLSEFKLSLMEG